MKRFFTILALLTFFGIALIYTDSLVRNKKTIAYYNSDYKPTPFYTGSDYKQLNLFYSENDFSHF